MHDKPHSNAVDCTVVAAGAKTRKTALTKPTRKMSYKAACMAGWQFVFHSIGNGNVACRATNRALGKSTAWLTDDTDGLGAVLAALAREEY